MTIVSVQSVELREEVNLRLALASARPRTMAGMGTGSRTWAHKSSHFLSGDSRPCTFTNRTARNL